MARFVPGRDARQDDGEGAAERAWWWCILRTERDRRLAQAAGRPIAAANLRRLLMRRLQRAGLWAVIERRQSND